jgi:hypothetical protein
LKFFREFEIHRPTVCFGGWLSICVSAHFTRFYGFLRIFTLKFKIFCAQNTRLSPSTIHRFQSKLGLGCCGKPAILMQKTAMTNIGSTTTLSGFAARLRAFISACDLAKPVGNTDEDKFNHLALELFALQFSHNAPYRKFCDSRKVEPQNVKHWSAIPAMPTSGFKELELTCLSPHHRTRVFHSSGTTEQRPSRHFHNDESLSIYEASLAPWFEAHFLPRTGAPASGPALAEQCRWLFLTPSPSHAQHSSLVHMFDCVRHKFGCKHSLFTGVALGDGTWDLDLHATLKALRESIAQNQPVMLCGTAFNFVHLLDHLEESGASLRLPNGSRVMETGGYKGRSRTLPKTELHGLITDLLGVPASHIICEYGMSELSSQAYDRVAGKAPADARVFHFPPWARAQMISPETGCEVREGETGLIRIFDLANVFSVMAIQTEDLGVRRGSGFELLGRAAMSEARGCSLMSR